MSIKKIKQFNNQSFFDDLKKVRDVMVLSIQSNVCLHVSKKELLKEAETSKIQYYLTDKIFVLKRVAMVII